MFTGERLRDAGIPRRHFIFSVLSDHVINRSQYESTIPLLHSACVACLQYTFYIYKYNRTFIKSFVTTSIVLRGYIVRVCISYALCYVKIQV